MSTTLPPKAKTSSPGENSHGREGVVVIVDVIALVVMLAARRE